jgi:hypothetical protein
MRYREKRCENQRRQPTFFELPPWLFGLSPWEERALKIGIGGFEVAQIKI